MRKATDKILEARDSGILPASISLDVYKGSMVAKTPLYGPADMEAGARWLAWFREAFPDGQVTDTAYCISRGKRGRPAVDRVEYRAKTEEGTVQLWTHGPHVHGGYYGEVRNGKPRWACRGCRKPITKTAARTLGLLP